MSSDLASDDDGEMSPQKAARQILRHEVQEGLEALERTSASLFMSALSGGLDVGFSLFLMTVLWTDLHDRISEPVVRILVGNMYSVGFILVIVGRSELFTEQTSLAVLPVLRGKATIGGLGRLWVIVYIGNLIGGAAFAGFISYVAPRLQVAEPLAFGVIAHRMIDHAPLMIFLSAVLAGWLMGLLSWMVSASRDTISQIVLIWVITSVIGVCGLHHVVLGTVEVLGGLFDGQDVTLVDFGRFLLFTTLGNAIGGSVFVALIKYGHARPTEPEE